MTDIVAIWDQHLGSEFQTQDIDAVMATMAPDGHVNHVPTMTGGVGAAEVRRFYSQHFIGFQPDDLEIVPVGRTVGADSIVDEMIVRFTHSCRMDFLLPGIEPTNARVEIATVAIARFRGDKLASEHVYWDQASILAQIGLLDPATLPIAAAESAQKVADPSIPSNRLMAAAWAASDPGAE